ncbi:MAG: DUF4830 domain-containing protein [Ruminococcaceae bacterium]|nr:DUF4830 domain-containing protein [Oscillospiraceae bacterium]
MFIYSVRASSLKFFAVLVLTVALLVGVWLTQDDVLAASSDGVVDFSGINTEEDRKSFIEGFGIKLSEEKEESESFVMPESFDRVMMGYNEIQKSQGLDLSKYARKKITRYTYKVAEYQGYDGDVVVNLFVFRDRIVGCDISSSDPNGFVKPLV